MCRTRRTHPKALYARRRRLVSGSGGLVLIQVAANEPHLSSRKTSIHVPRVSSIRCQKTSARQGSPLLTAIILLPRTKAAGTIALRHLPAAPVVNYENEESRQCFRSCIVPGTTRKESKTPARRPFPHCLARKRQAFRPVLLAPLLSASSI